MKKIAVTGAKGFFGARLCRYYQKKYEVIELNHERLDITSKDAVAKVLYSIRPDYVLHCAAVSDTGYAQSHPGESYNINVNGSVNVALGSLEAGAKLIYMSSDQVYSGYEKPGAISESTEIFPDNEYGKQKLEAEHRITEILPQAVGLRLTWMFDLPNRNLKTNSNLVWNIVRASMCRQTLFFRDFEYRGITYVWDAVERMEQAMKLPGGVYNYGSGNSWSTYETARFTAERLKLSEMESLIGKAGEQEKGRLRNLSIDTAKLMGRGIEFEGTADGIIRCIEEYYG